MARALVSRGIEVFFATHLSRPVNAVQLRSILEPLGPEVMRRALANWRELQRRHPGLAVISVRELFAGVEQDVRDRALKRFTAARALQPYGNPAPSGVLVAKTVVRYGGPYPEALPPRQARWFFERMREIQTTAAAVLQEGLAVSSSHVVISARQGRWMTITATNTDKTQVHLFSQTPLVTQTAGRFTYYGDPSFPPSSETDSHWHLHGALEPLAPAAGRFLLHFHHAGLRDAVRAGETLALGSLRIPCMAPLTYGTRDQGLAMAAAMRRADTRALTLAEHGTWFTERSFAAALRLARKAVSTYCCM